MKHTKNPPKKIAQAVPRARPWIAEGGLHLATAAHKIREKFPGVYNGNRKSDRVKSLRVAAAAIMAEALDRDCNDWD